MPKYKVHVPGVLEVVEANSSKEALDLVMPKYLKEINELYTSGDLYKVPESAMEVGGKTVNEWMQEKTNAKFRRRIGGNKLEVLRG